MRHWARLRHHAFCGQCRKRPIPIGEPVLLIKFDNIKRELIRCMDCAGPAPPDLPPLGDAPVVLRTKRMTSLRNAQPEWLPHRND